MIRNFWLYYATMTLVLPANFINAVVFKTDGTQPINIEFSPNFKNVHYLTEEQTDEIATSLQAELESYVFGEQLRGRRPIMLPQKTFFINNDTLVNAPTEYPTPYSTISQQYLLRANELHAAGIETSAFIKLSFDVCQTSFELNPSYKGLANMVIKMGHTAVNELTTFQENLSTYYSAFLFAEKTGWNDHSFLKPFYWDGVRNIVIEINAQNYATPAQVSVNQSLTDFVSSITQETPDLEHYYQRPNIKITTITSKISQPHRVETPHTFSPASQPDHHWALGSDNILYYWDNKMWHPIINEKFSNAIDFVSVPSKRLVYCLNEYGQLFTGLDHGSNTQWEAFPTDLTFAELKLSGNANITGLTQNRRDVYQLKDGYWKFIKSYTNERSLKSKT